MQNPVRWVLWVLVSGLAALPAQGAFSSLYVFGDATSTTTDNTGGDLYYQHTYCNGRVWVQVLAQRQGVAYDPNKNQSYWGNYSWDAVTETSHFSAADATNSLFVVWVSDADFVYVMLYEYPPVNPTTWNSAANTCLANLAQAISNLYARGARTIIMPNAVDLTEVPYYGGLASYPADRAFIRQQIINFNTSFIAMVNQARASLPGLTIIIPDIFSLLDDMLAHPASYGLVNPGVDALEDPNLTDYSLNGPGAYYVFWDYQNPTAKVHEIIADITQRMLSPVKTSKLTLLGASNRLDVVNVPIGLNGFVDGKTNLVLGSWTSLTNVNSLSASQPIFVPAAGSWRYYRLRFPFTWSPP